MTDGTVSVTEQVTAVIIDVINKSNIAINTEQKYKLVLLSCLSLTN